MRGTADKTLTLQGVRGNAGIKAAYRKKLNNLIDEMHASIVYWVSSAYKDIPQTAMDSNPVIDLSKSIKKVSKQWQDKFNKSSLKLAEWFALKTKNYSDVALNNTLKDAGFSVKFTMTEKMQSAYDAVISENVGLIKSIASQHLTQVEGLVMRSVQTGRDLGYLAKQLEKQFGVTKRRAAFIARDQNNKATSTINRVRQKELGITQAKWRHSHAGKHPRPSHLAADGDIYDIDKGMYLDGVWTWPGVEINCRCVAQPLIKGFIY